MFDLTTEQQKEKDDFIKNFPESWYYKKLINTNLEKYRYSLNPSDSYPRPREYLGLYYDAEIFYYLNYIFEKNPEAIYDIGCGNGFFKYVFGDTYNIIGVDKDNCQNVDIVSKFQDFFIENKGKIKAAYAINSIHGCPINELIDRIKEFISIFDKGGVGFCTFSYSKIVRQTSSDFFKNVLNVESYEDIGQHNFVNILLPYLENQINDCVNNLKDNVKFDIIELNKSNYRNRINGGMRLSFTVIDPI